MNDVRLSISMIVKNEQKNLPRCLESVKNLHAELIVVDTGSVDQTVKIAKDYGAKVYYHPWENDFSKHRNQSFSYATGDWILQIDADEELVFFNNRDPRILLRYLEHVKGDMNALAFRCVDIMKKKEIAQTLLVRLFRNGKVKYKRAIHNEPMYKGNTGICQIALIKHYGYDLEPHEKVNKANRTIKLLKSELDKNPNDFDSMFYISQAYSSFADNLDEGIKWAIRYAEKRKKIKEGKFHNSVYWSIISYYLNRSDAKNAWKWLEIALKEIPGDLDISMALLRYGILTKNQSFVGAGARAFVTAYENFNDDIIKRGSQFIFNYSKNSYVFALFHLSTTYLQHSVISLKTLYKEIENIEPKFKEEIQEGLNLWFEKNNAIFKHNNAVLSAAKTARTLHSFSPESDSKGLRANIYQ